MATRSRRSSTRGRRDRWGREPGVLRPRWRTRAFMSFTNARPSPKRVRPERSRHRCGLEHRAASRSSTRSAPVTSPSSEIPAVRPSPEARALTVTISCGSVRSRTRSRDDLRHAAMDAAGRRHARTGPVRSRDRPGSPPEPRSGAVAAATRACVARSGTATSTSARSAAARAWRGATSRSGHRRDWDDGEHQRRDQEGDDRPPGAAEGGGTVHAQDRYWRRFVRSRALFSLREALASSVSEPIAATGVRVPLRSWASRSTRRRTPLARRSACTW
jgi:hypothetical protein